MLARRGKQTGLDILDQPLAVAREELDRILCRLVGTQQAIFLIAATALDGRIEDVIHAQDHPGAGIPQDAFGPGPGMDVAGDDGVRILEDGFGPVREDNLNLGAAFPDQFGIIGDVIHPREFMHAVAEEFAVALQRQDVGIGIDSGLVHAVDVDQRVAHLVRRIGKHQDNLLHAGGDTSQADGETVAAQDGEDDAYGPAAGFGTHVRRDGGNGCVIALGTGHDGLRHADHIAVAKRKSFTFSGFEDAGGDDGCQVVALTDDRATDAAGHGPDFSFLIFHILTNL